ncbi:MAG: family 4 glycosyl hydrolase [Planctomycetota bacterium]
MTDRLTICIVGAGSSYTPELVEGLIEQSRAGLPVGSIRLTDVNAERLKIMAGLSQRMIRHAGCEIEVRSGERLEEMLAGAEFVITQIRVGGMPARHLDESIPLKYGIIGQETTGPGGMFKALRTIPQMIEIAGEVAKVSPEAFILNYTNPSGIITEAVSKYTPARIIGLCSGMPHIQADLAKRLAAALTDLKTYCVGLNHLGFVYRFVSGGRDVTAEAIKMLAEQLRARQDSSAAQRAGLIELLQAVPIGYLNYYFHRGRAVAQARAAGRTRAQRVEQLEKELFAAAADAKTATKPEILNRRGGGGYAGVTFSVMKAIVADTGEEITVNVPNRGSVAGIEDDAVVEVTSRVGRGGAEPVVVGDVPPAFRGLMQAVKAYETLTVEAAVRRSKKLARLALLNHPLAGDLDVIDPLVEEMLRAHRLQFS